MTTILNSAETAYYASLSNASGKGSNWLADTETAIKNQSQQGGLLGMLSTAAANDGSLKSFISNSTTTANAFAAIAQTSVTSATSLAVQMAAQNQKAAAAKKLQAAQTAQQQAQQAVKPTNTLEPIIFLPDGSTIDTNSNIMTMADGTQYDVTTGAKYVDPADIIQMANGAYLNTKTNILTMPDGSQIDTVTGLKVSVTA